MNWEDHVVEKQALRDDQGRIINASDNRSPADIVSQEVSPVEVIRRLGVPPQVARRMMTFIGRLVQLPTLTAQRIVIAIIEGESDSLRIAESLKLSRWTVWRVRRRLERDPFWGPMVGPSRRGGAR